MKRTWSCVAVGVLSVLLCASGWAAPPVTYARLSLGQGEKTVYLSFENARLRLATSTAGLDKAPVVQAKEREIGGGEGSRSQRYTFTNVDLPAAPSGFSGASGTFTYLRSSQPTRGTVKPREFAYLYGDVTLTQREASGTTWGYVYNVSGDAGRNQTGGDKQHPIAVTVPKPDPATLTFEIATKIEGRKARIAMQAKADKTDINNILKNGKPAPATLEVTDRDGKVIVSEKGDPQKFGFTWGGPCYSVRIAKKGTYTVKMTAELGPNQTVTKEAKFLVK